MTDLIKYVQEMALTVITLQKKVSALETENLHVTTERDSCEETCKNLEKQIIIEALLQLQNYIDYSKIVEEEYIERKMVKTLEWS